MLMLPDFKQKQVILIFSREGQHLKLKNDNLLVLGPEKDLILQLSCHKILSIWIIGNTSLTSGILEKSKKCGFSIFLLSTTFKPIGCWASSTEGNFLLRSKQYEYKDLEIGKYLVKIKLSNQLNMLKSIRQKSPTLKNIIIQINQNIKNVDSINQLDKLMGLEGMTARIYFKEWFTFYEWNGRKPRTKSDPINVLMDMGYTYLFNFIESLLLLYGFDIYKGVLHQVFYQRKSLVCDLVEPFRCLIDHKIKVAHNLGQINESDFEKKQNQYRLTFEKAKPYTKLLVEAILEQKTDIFLFIQSYYRQFMKNAPISTYPIFEYPPTKD